MTAVIDAAALNHLGAVVHKMRPTWDAPGIRSALEKALTAHPYPLVAIVAIASARDPKAATPGVIGVRCANGWMAATPEEKPATPTADRLDGRCQNSDCRAWIVRGEEHTCAPVADPHEGAAKARAAIKATVRYETEESNDE